MNGGKSFSSRSIMCKVYYVAYVKSITPDGFPVDRAASCCFNRGRGFSIIYRTAGGTGLHSGIIDLTVFRRRQIEEGLMSKPKHPGEKYRALKTSGALNPRYQRIKDSLFAEHEFFDPYDLVQVKYEMLRKVQKEGKTVQEACESFGFSRVWFYRIKADYQEKGLLGLIPQKHGPKRSHKLSETVMDFIAEAKSKDRTLDSGALAEMVGKRFAICVHPRSIERALVRRKKKRSKP